MTEDANALRITQWARNDGNQQQWQFDGNGANQQFSMQDIDSYVQLINRNSGKAIEVQGASTTADGGNIVQYSDWNGGSARQRW